MIDTLYCEILALSLWTAYTPVLLINEQSESDIQQVAIAVFYWMNEKWRFSDG